jgi:hypothetical protein
MKNFLEIFRLFNNIHPKGHNYGIVYIHDGEYYTLLNVSHFVTDLPIVSGRRYAIPMFGGISKLDFTFIKSNTQP